MAVRLPVLSYKATTIFKALHASSPKGLRPNQGPDKLVGNFIDFILKKLMCYFETPMI